MSEAEIRRDYREAKDRRRQIQVLADLNQTSKQEIVQLLLRCGEQVDGRLIPGKKSGRQPAAPAGETVGAAERDPADRQEESAPHTHTHTHTHTGAAPRACVTVGELVELLRQLPQDAKVQLPEDILLSGYVLAQGFNALTGERAEILTLV